MVKVQVIKSNHESIRVGDIWHLNIWGERYESNGFFFDLNSDGLYEMLLFRGDVLMRAVSNG